MNKKFLLNDIYDNYRQRGHEDVMIPIMKFIEKKILPMYDTSTYLTKGTEAQLIKIRFTERIYQICHKMPYICPEDEFTFGVVCTDISLVENEFHPVLHVKEQGKRSADFTRVNFGGYLTDQFHYDPHDESSSIIPSIEETDHIVYSSKDDDNQYATTTYYGRYLYDIKQLALPCTLEFDEFIHMLLLDHLRDEHDGKLELDEITDEEICNAGDDVTIFLKCTYGPTGCYRIISREYQDCPELAMKFFQFQNTLLKFIETNKGDFNDVDFWSRYL